MHTEKPPYISRRYHAGRYTRTCGAVDLYAWARNARTVKTGGGGIRSRPMPRFSDTAFYPPKTQVPVLGQLVLGKTENCSVSVSANINNYVFPRKDVYSGYTYGDRVYSYYSYSCAQRTFMTGILILLFSAFFYFLTRPSSNIRWLSKFDCNLVLETVQNQHCLIKPLGKCHFNSGTS